MLDTKMKLHFENDIPDLSDEEIEDFFDDVIAGKIKPVGSLVANNCGIGPNGFEPDNDCSKGGGSAVDIGSIKTTTLSLMSKRLKSKGFDIRGSKDVRELLAKSVNDAGKSLIDTHPDWKEAYSSAIASGTKAKEKKANKSEVGKNVRWDRLKQLGYTDDWNETGYLNPEGKKLDFSGKREGGSPGMRSYDHREIGGTSGMMELQSLGYIRVMQNSGLDIAKEPTASQYREIARFLNDPDMKGVAVNIDLDNGIGEWDSRNEYYSMTKDRATRGYSPNTNPSKIINDIKKYYKQFSPTTNSCKFTTNKATATGQNCGIGRRGFEKGNKCAKGGSGPSTIVTPEGEKLRSATRVDGVWKYDNGKDAPPHIQKLGIPPAWINVYVNPNPKGANLAKGEDTKGRIQGRYGDSHNAQSAAAKFGRVTELRAKRQQIYGELAKDSKNPELRDKADCLNLIMRTGIRPGGGKETFAEFQSYGAITLEGRHVHDNKDGTVTLKFVPGKSHGQEKEFQVTDKATARMLLNRARTAGKDGRLFDTTDKHLRAYSQSKDGGGFKTKDHRTALGTEIAIAAIKKLGNKKKFESEKEYQSAVKAVGEQVANMLGNTWKVSVKHYIDTTVFSGWSY